ncbi:MAG: alpha-hydroxy-acid oxidizing protein [Treponema sp.]|nr:alpha-hydroxy-acid oxidizing protein [Treponema sp.]MBR4629830.1 alpha-hydroxy-acid oxidizing protein [Treponema sp.]MCR5124150.1 alpha-hydroxy-acid oxidizing protein [Treponema sp.]
MGGVRDNENFILNVSDWEKVRREYSEKIDEFLDQPVEFRIPHIAIAPITGAIENIGFADERNYYAEIVAASKNVGIGLCIGDGYPDEKLKFGIEAIRGVESTAAVFIKPYENHRIIERIGWSSEIASIIGIDIDSYNILTMRNMVNLEKKSAEQLMEIQDFVHDKLGLPFAIKGIFTEDDIKLVEQVQPDIAYISNHGGRIDTRTGSTAEFLAHHADELKPNCHSVWVDGGIRSPLDIATAHALGADRVLIGRPFVTALCRGGESALCGKVLELALIQYAR